MQEPKIKIKEGYKNTQIGWIPEAWNIIKLGSYVSIQSGVSPSNYTLSDSGIYPYLKVEDLNNCWKYQSASRFYIEDKNSLVASRSIIFPKRGAAILNNKVRITKCLSQMDSNMMALTVVKENLDYEYLFYTIVQERLSKIADTSTIPQINNKHIIPYRIALPPLLEQKKIAEILSTWDFAIEQTQKLLEQLKLRKKGLMQQLLTCKRRLTGFSGEWEEVRMESVTSKLSRRNKELINASVYSVTNKNGFVLQADHFDRNIAGDNLSSHKIIKKGEFAYNPARVNVGSIAYFEKEIGVISSLYVCFRTSNKLDDTYLNFWLQLDKTKHDINSFGEGGVRVYLWYELFGKIKIQLPTLEEQRAIAKVLMAADDEIKTQEAYLEKLQTQKKGLMQKLLTGEIRVSVVGEN